MVDENGREGREREGAAGGLRDMGEKDGWEGKEREME